jgi:hypothetical protein
MKDGYCSVYPTHACCCQDADFALAMQLIDHISGHRLTLHLKISFLQPINRVKIDHS